MANPLFGRGAETGVLDEILTDAANGIGRACVVHGDAGMGKTRLLEYAVEAAPQLHHVWITGVASETVLGYAGLHRLFLPFLPQLDRLPGPQRDALACAFGLDVGRPADLFLIGLACLTLMTEAAADLGSGLLCVIDDAQWLDDESLAVLAFVGRRLSADRIVLLFGVRDGDDSGRKLAGLQTLEVRGLPDDAAMELLATKVDVSVDTGLASRIVASTGGCPLALLELTSTLTADQLRGERPVNEPIPIGRQLENHFMGQVGALSEPAQLFVLVAATESSGDPDLVRRVVRRLHPDGSASEGEAIDHDLLSTRPTITFRHPLVRSAVYASASEELRRAVHTALADEIDGSTDPDRRAQHLAAAAVGPDEGVATELEAAAHRARNRGGYSAEASFLAQSAQLTLSNDRRARRLLQSATAAMNAGQPHRAESLLDQARPELEGVELRAEAMRLDGRLRVPLAQPPAAPALLLRAAEEMEPLGPARVREVLLEAIDTCIVSLEFTTGATIDDVGRAALSTPRDEDGQPSLKDLLLDGIGHSFLDQYDLATPLLREAAAVLGDLGVDRHDVPLLQGLGYFATNEIWDQDSYGKWAAHVERVAREQGALYTLQTGLSGLAQYEIRRGRFAAARGMLDEVVELTHAVAELDYGLLDVELLAWQGSDTAIPKALLLIEGATMIGSRVPVAMAQIALANLALGTGRYNDALDAITPLIDTHVPGWSGQALAIGVEAATRSGAHAVAERCLGRLDRRASAAATPWALGLLERCRALVAPDAAAEQHHLDGIAHLERTSVATDVARSHLVFGEWLRRQDRKQDAGVELRIAQEMFAEMGANAFASRAEGELAASGQRRQHRRTDPSASGLTPQETQVARLAAAGATNAEIGVRLFISANTVDYHLRKVFRKLGITSRRQLLGQTVIMDGVADGT